MSLNPRVFRVSTSPMPKDIDDNEHVSNVAYLRMVQDAVIGHWRSAVDRSTAAAYRWIAIEHTVRYRAEAVLHDTLDIVTQLLEIKMVRTSYHTRILRGSELIAEARSIWCATDPETKKPKRISGLVRQLFDVDNDTKTERAAGDVKPGPGRSASGLNLSVFTPTVLKAGTL